MMPSVEHKKEKSAKGIFAFVVNDDPVLTGTLIQVTRSGRIHIYPPEYAPEEEIVEETLQLVRRANGGSLKVLRKIIPRQSYRTESELKTAMRHSRFLVLGLEYLLLEDRPMWVEERHSSAWTFKVQTKGAKVKQFAEQHLKDKKYSAIYRKLEAHRSLNRKITREYKSGEISEPVFDVVINAAENPDESLSEEQEKQIMETMKEKWASYEKLAHDVRLLETKVRHGTPLSGKCELCRD